jgi:LacI family transcriptional regulator
LQIDLKNDADNQPVPPTIADVARAAGVSVTTISHVLSGNRPVSLATQARVREVIEALGYRPNPVARSLRTQRSHTVGLVIPDITNPYYPMLARGLQDVIAEAGYHVFVCSTDARAERELEFVTDLAERRVDGLFIAAFGADPELLGVPAARGIATVSLGARIDHPAVDVVDTDDADGAARATEHLIGLGHLRIGLIAGPPPIGQRRAGGYRRALEAADVPFAAELVQTGDWTRASGRPAMRALAALEEPPTAVFCANDLMAIGALDAARDLGLDVPRDLSLVGFDDIEAAALLTPALTTVLNPAHAVGEAAGRLLLERLSGSPTKRTVLHLPCTLIERASTTTPRS